MNLDFPKEYPFAPCNLTVEREPKNPCMPDILCDYINDETKKIILVNVGILEDFRCLPKILGVCRMRAVLMEKTVLGTFCHVCETYTVVVK